MKRAAWAAPCALILFIFLLPTLRARAADPPLLTIEAAVEEALRANPEIAAAEHAWKAAEEVPRQASSLEDPRVSYEAYNIRNSFAFDQAPENIYSVTQAVPFPTKLLLRGRSARKAAEAEKQRLEEKRLEIAARVKAAYADLFEAEREIDLYRRTEEVARRLAGTAEAKYATGEVPQEDLLKAQVALSTIQRDLNSFEEARSAALARLNALLDRPQERTARTVESLPVTPLARGVEELEREAAEKRPRVRAAALEVGRADVERKLARTRYLPDFEVTARRFVNRGEDNGYGAMFMVNVPWVWLQKHRAGNREAVERRLEAASRLRAEKNDTAMGVRELYAGTTRAFRNAELLRTTLLPQSRLAFESTLATYEVGEGEFLNVLDSFQTLLFLEAQRVEEVASYHRRLAALEATVGGRVQ